MAEKKASTGLVAVDAEAQRLIRDETKKYVVEAIEKLAEIMRNGSTRDAFKASVKLIDYHARGGSNSDENADGSPRIGIMVVQSNNTRELDEASDELRRLQALTMTAGRT